MNILITDSKAIRDAYLRNGEFKEAAPSVYHSDTDTLYFSEVINVSFIQSIFAATKQIEARMNESNEKTRTLILEDISPKLSVWCLVEGRATCTEHQNGDIILPNTFLKYSHEIDAVNFDKTNQDSFLHDPLFLTQYEQQTDVDFELFGLSIGGINVTKNDGLDDVSKESVEFAYSADSVDSILYFLVQEAITAGCSEQFFPLVLVLDGSMGEEKKWQLAEHIPAVITYFCDENGEDTTTDKDDEESENE
jgi:hypothetical protein